MVLSFYLLSFHIYPSFCDNIITVCLWTERAGLCLSGTLVTTGFLAEKAWTQGVAWALEHAHAMASSKMVFLPK